MSAVTRHGFVKGADGTTPDLRVNRQGSVVQIDQYLQWTLEGRVFFASDADGDDTVAAIAAWVATTPQLLLRVPTGTSAIPLWTQINHTAATAGATGAFIIMTDRVDRYASGGTAESISHMRTDRPNAPACTVYSTPTASAATDARVLFVKEYETDDGTTGASAGLERLWSARDHYAPLLVGPAAFLVWIDDNATTPAFNWSLGWAEFSTADIT